MTHYGTGSAPGIFRRGLRIANHLVAARLSDIAGQFGNLARRGFAVVEGAGNVVRKQPMILLSSTRAPILGQSLERDPHQLAARPHAGLVEQLLHAPP